MEDQLPQAASEHLAQPNRSLPSSVVVKHGKLSSAWAVRHLNPVSCTVLIATTSIQTTLSLQAIRLAGPTQKLFLDRPVPVPSPSSRKNISFFWAASRFRRAAVSCLGIPDPDGIKVNYPSGGLSMTPSRRKRHKPEQIVAKQCDAEAILNAGKELTAVLHGLSLATRPGHGRRRCALSMRLSLGRRMSSGLPTRRCRRWPTPSRTAAAASGRRTMGSSAPRGGDPEGAQRPPARCL